MDLNEIAKMIKDLNVRLDKHEKDMKTFQGSIKDTIAIEATFTKNLGNRLEVKLDTILNGEKSIAPSTASKPVKDVGELKELPFFKQMATDDLDKYVNVLYSSADLEAVRNSEDVKSKATPKTKANKIVSLLYNNYIKKNKQTMAKLTELRDQFLLSNESEESKED